MAETKTNRGELARQGGQGPGRSERERQGLQQWGSPLAARGGPFELFDRISDEMDRTFARVWRDFGFGRPGSLSRSGSRAVQGLWSPRIEAFQKGDQFVVRAELPGLKKDDVNVELTEDAITIRGERREEHEEEREGFYHTEREYGQFQRTIQLPEGVIGESAQANFRDGVLEIRMQAPPAEASRGRRLEIKEGAQGEERK